MQTLKTYLTALFLSWVLLLGFVSPADAEQGQVLGIHILHPYEIDRADELLESADGLSWQYVTIPLALSDLDRSSEWQLFFQDLKRRKLIPIVRLATEFQDGSWQVPTRKQLTDLTTFMNTLDWPTQDRYVIVLNEPNHAKEFGGRIDPESYADLLSFMADWLHSENQGYVVLPAGLDLAAPNGAVTRDAFTYLDQMLLAQPDLLSKIDVWNSHSYPNPGFSSSPERTGRNSIRGFEYELAYLRDRTGRDYQVFITETGWVSNAYTQRWLSSYYQYAMEHVWSDPRVIAVTPFILQGAPGPFADFSFLDETGRPTDHYTAYRQLIEGAPE